MMSNLHTHTHGERGRSAKGCVCVHTINIYRKGDKIEGEKKKKSLLPISQEKEKPTREPTSFKRKKFTCVSTCLFTVFPSFQQRKWVSVCESIRVCICVSLKKKKTKVYMYNHHAIVLFKSLWGALSIAFHLYPFHSYSKSRKEKQNKNESFPYCSYL